MADDTDSRSNARRGTQPGELTMLGSESACAYLPGQMSRMEYRLAAALTSQRYEDLLSRGWRRFGRTLFRPKCRGCRECQSLRVDLNQFRPSKSQRKCRNRNAEIDCVISTPTITRDHITLYNRYHLDMHQRRNWPFRKVTPEDYFDSFLDGRFPFSHEFQYWQADRLIGIGIVDMTPTALSSVYFYHDPDLRDAALGTYSVLAEIAAGQRTGRQQLYLGYYIRDCGSMNYKNRFRPYQILRDYVSDTEQPQWDTPPDSITISA